MHKSYKKIPATKNTPEVILDSEGTIEFSGRLIPENAEEFFQPVIEWIEEYSLNTADVTTVEIRLEYMNSAGTKYLLGMMDKINSMNRGKLVINWYYEEADQDMLDKGTILSMNLNVPFNFIASN